jgi:hypothetical protein
VRLWIKPSLAGEEAETYKFTLAKIRLQAIDTPDSRGERTAVILAHHTAIAKRP